MGLKTRRRWMSPFGPSTKNRLWHPPAKSSAADFFIWQLDNARYASLNRYNDIGKDLAGGLAGRREPKNIQGDRRRERRRGSGGRAMRHEKKETIYPPRPRMPWLLRKGPLTFLLHLNTSGGKGGDHGSQSGCLVHQKGCCGYKCRI